MSKLVRMFVVAFGIIIQLILAVLYGFASVPVSESVCFVIWCLCAVMISKTVRIPEAV